MERKNDQQVLSSVQNALKILKSYTLEEPEKKVTDIARQLGISKSSASRLLHTLEEEGFVEQDEETKRFKLGYSALTLSGVITSQLDLHHESLPVLRKLVDEVGETAHIAVLEDTDVIYLHKIECNHRMRILTHIGRRNPVHCTSSGKLLLSYQDDIFLEHVLAGELKAYTEKTITDPQLLRQDLIKIREQGYCVCEEEILEGVVAIAAPVLDFTGKVIAAVNIVGPMQRINSLKLPVYLRKVIRAGREISDRMGYF